MLKLSFVLEKIGHLVFMPMLPPDHLLLNSAPNLGPRISRWEINKFKNCWYKSVRIVEDLRLLFQQFLNLSSSQRDMSGPILGALSNNRWSWGTSRFSLHRWQLQIRSVMNRIGKSNQKRQWNVLQSRFQSPSSTNDRNRKPQEQVLLWTSRVLRNLRPRQLASWQQWPVRRRESWTTSTEKAPSCLPPARIRTAPSAGPCSRTLGCRGSLRSRRRWSKRSRPMTAGQTDAGARSRR
jgi:hypothetical protein